MRSRKRVIVADDHAVFRECFIRILQEFGDLDVVGEAENGIQAVELTMRLRPDIVIMDVHMPLMDGIQATRQIANTIQAVRIIGLSMGNDLDEDQMLEAGAAAYIQKDGLIGKLLITVESFRETYLV